MTDFTKEARALKVAIEPNVYPSVGGGADIDNGALPIIETTLREIARQAASAERDRILALLPGGQSCDPQQIADAIRATI